MKFSIEVSLLFLAALLALLLLFTTFHDIGVVCPHSLDVFIVLFFSDFKGRRQQLDDVGMFETVGPVRGTITARVSHVKIDVLGHEELDELGMTLPGRDMQAAEALLVLSLWVSTTVQKLCDDFFHISFSG